MKRWAISILICIVCAFAFAQNTTILVDFKYKNMSTETKETADGKIEKTVKDFGQSDVNLQLRDLIVYKLQDKKYDATSEVKKDYGYVVKIQDADTIWTYLIYYTMLIEIYNNKNELMSKKLFQGFQKHVNDFPDDVSTEIVTFIAEVLKK